MAATSSRGVWRTRIFIAAGVSAFAFWLLITYAWIASIRGPIGVGVLDRGNPFINISLVCDLAKVWIRCEFFAPNEFDDGEVYWDVILWPEPRVDGTIFDARPDLTQTSFLYKHDSTADDPDAYSDDEIGHLIDLVLPCWLLWLIASIVLWPFARRFRRYCRTFRAERRIAAGLCAACGYDMRATPSQCPECGHAASPAMTSCESMTTDTAGSVKTECVSDADEAVIRNARSE